MSILYAVTLIYEVMAALATAELFHQLFACVEQCAGIAMLFGGEVLEFVVFSGLTFTLWPYLKEIRQSQAL